MKNLIASLAFLAICFSVSAQAKKQDSTKRPLPVSTTKPGDLVQEKIWPTSNPKNGKVIPAHPVMQTKLKL